MKILFSKISKVNYPFKLDLDNMSLVGFLKRENEQIVNLEAKMSGTFMYLCAKCGCELELNIDEDIKLSLSDGVYKDIDNQLSDTMEFFNSEIDLLEILESELNLYLSDNFYCLNCEKE
ncbi:hypothetical protein AVCANL279_07235 [Campylobacter canadensis]|uniref:hypothetical protein n=1 Tax=Campylobacter canadensis TaxID=449520 RepID=UPI001557B115|nr:hypothetical protein [Campylobacter canadensis]MBZ7994532.1 hypothetical protein [Campylobacter canadensis]MBZ7997111.1 hypothetical protein [Campylobacter canadensis]MBZ7999863.1 hypothetical protein [Campylobacter canadensis]MBZ8001809.1 hypothetical protein [Campylobacter canadensis]MBZ8004424.1 hypothetical protein [Campylobacter canadensis]